MPPFFIFVYILIIMQQAISAGHEITLEVAKEILLHGGNAFDAAIAAHLAMFITEPCMASAGGAGFAMTYQNGQVNMFDFFSQTPASKINQEIDYFPIVVDFGNEKEEFHIGIATAAVPGTIAGLFALHAEFASMPFKELIEPAKKLALEGVKLNIFQAYDLSLLEPIFKQDESGRKIFFNDSGIKKENDTIKMPQMADFLDFLVDEGEEGFYLGEIGSKISKDVKERGGHLNRKDFENYSVYKKDPFNIATPYGDLHLPNGPSIGAALFGCAYGNYSSSSLEEAIIKSQIDNTGYKNLESNLEKIFPKHNYNSKASGAATKGTSHFNIIDKKGNAIALTSTIGEGCGYFIPGTSMHLNNMLGEVFLLPDGAHSWVPNTRLNSMMTPLILTDHSREVSYISGSGGASRIPFALLQVFLNVFEKEMILKLATEAPRAHFQDDCLHLEGDYPETKATNFQINQWNKKSLYFGGVHSILRHKDKLEAEGDARRYGVAEVF